MVSRKLKPYFKSHNNTVVTTFPIKQVLTKPDNSGRLKKWVIELGEYDLLYKPHTTIKSQVLADFIVDFSVHQMIEAKKELFRICNVSFEY